MPWILHNNGDDSPMPLERGFFVCAPPDWWNQAGPIPVILVFHPGHNNIIESYRAIAMHELLYEGFQQGMIDAGLPAPKMVVVYLQAQGMDVGPTGHAHGTFEHGTTEPVSAVLNVDDVGFTKAVLDLLQAR